MGKRVAGQLTLALQADDLAFDSLGVTSSNRVAITALTQSSGWPRPQVCLHGPAKSGLTSLARAWVAREGGRYIDARSFGECRGREIDRMASGVVALDGADHVDDGARLRGLMTQAGETGGRLLLLSNRVPADWPFRQADLVSRIRALPVIEIGPPDAEMMQLRLERGLAKFYHRLPEDVAAYLLVRLPRSYAQVERCVEHLAAAAQGTPRGITVPLAREVLDKDAGIDQARPDDDGSE